MDLHSAASRQARNCALRRRDTNWEVPGPERREDTPQDPDPGVPVPRVQEAHPVAAQSTPAAALGRGRQSEGAPRQSPPRGNR